MKLAPFYDEFDRNIHKPPPSVVDSANYVLRKGDYLWIQTYVGIFKMRRVELSAGRRLDTYIVKAHTNRRSPWKVFGVWTKESDISTLGGPTKRSL